MPIHALPKPLPVRRCPQELLLDVGQVADNFLPWLAVHSGALHEHGIKRFPFTLFTPQRTVFLAHKHTISLTAPLTAATATSSAHPRLCKPPLPASTGPASARQSIARWCHLCRLPIVRSRLVGAPLPHRTTRL